MGAPALDALIVKALKTIPTLAAISARLQQAQERLAGRFGSTQCPQDDVAVGVTAANYQQVIRDSLRSVANALRAIENDAQ